MDPGLQRTGFGIIDFEGNSLKHIHHGVIQTVQTDDIGKRLFHLFKEISNVIEDYGPHQAAVEETFVNKNPASTLKLGMARGVVLFTPASMNLPVFEYSANKVKKTVVGAGHADKDQVQAMVRRMLPVLQSKLQPDAADALAIAICHAHHSVLQNRYIA